MLPEGKSLHSQAPAYCTYPQPANPVRAPFPLPEDQF